MVDKRTGVAEAVADAAAHAAEIAPPLPLPLDAPMASADQAEKRGRGRPRGARNLGTKQLRSLILARHEHPLIALAEAYSLPLEDLARRLGCSKAAAFDRQIAAAKAVAEFIEPKLQRIALTDGGGAPLPALTVVVGSGAPAALGDDLPDGAKVLTSKAFVDVDGDELETVELETARQAVDCSGFSLNFDSNR